jgi:hypothetical protein
MKMILLLKRLRRWRYSIPRESYPSDGVTLAGGAKGLPLYPPALPRELLRRLNYATGIVRDIWEKAS